MVLSRSLTSAPGYDDHTLGGAELEEIKSLRVLEVTFDSEVAFEMFFREVVSQAARNLGVVRRAGKLFDCLRVLKSCFNAYVLSSLEYCAPLCISSAESSLGLLDRIVRSVERLFELCCLGHRRKGNACVCSMRFITE